MEALSFQDFMAGISFNTVSQQSDNIIEQKHQPHHQQQQQHQSHQHHHHHLHQTPHHPLHHQQQLQHHHQHSNQSNSHPQSQNSNSLISLFDFPYSPESSKIIYNSTNALDIGNMDTPIKSDGDISSLTGEMANSDDGLNIAAEGGSISFMRDGSKGSKKNLDKESVEYKKRRARNNVAVRKSREKAKLKSQETERKVSELQNENECLKRTVGELSGKMMVLRRLLFDRGVAQDYIEDELNRSFTEPRRSKGGN